jgi:hypothetical protein
MKRIAFVFLTILALIMPIRRQLIMTRSTLNQKLIRRVGKSFFLKMFGNY